jgi:hypothetical protein
MIGSGPALFRQLTRLTRRPPLNSQPLYGNLLLVYQQRTDPSNLTATSLDYRLAVLVAFLLALLAPYSVNPLVIVPLEP